MIQDVGRRNGIAGMKKQTQAQAQAHTQAQTQAQTQVQVQAQAKERDDRSRTRTLCHRIREAFPEDAEALGCQKVETELEAESVINTVCSRLRFSVPTVSPEQFGCPKRAV